MAFIFGSHKAGDLTFTVYGHEPGANNRSAVYEQPDFAKVHQQMESRKNMTLVYLWGRYQKDCKR